jgi:hypothetical protein
MIPSPDRRKFEIVLAGNPDSFLVSLQSRLTRSRVVGGLIDVIDVLAWQ